MLYKSAILISVTSLVTADTTGGESGIGGIGGKRGKGVYHDGSDGKPGYSPVNSGTAGYFTVNRTDDLTCEKSALTIPYAMQHVRILLMQNSDKDINYANDLLEELLK